MAPIDRRKFVATAGSITFASIAGCTSGDGGDGGADSDGGGSGDNNGGATETDTATETETTTTTAAPQLEQLGISSFTSAGGGWLTAFHDAARFYCEDQGIDVNVFGNEQSTSKQISDIKKMVNQGFDGIAANVWETDGANAAIEEAVAAGIPVFTVNADASTEAVTMNIAFASEEISYHAGQKLVEFMREQKPDLDEYRVLNVRGALIQEGDLRSEGFKRAVDEHDDVVLADTINGKFQRQEGLKQAQQWFNANEPVDGFYSANITMELGVLDALDREGLLHPAGEDGHITTTCMSSSPEGDERIRNGFIDLAVGSEPYPMFPIAIRYMQQYIEAGMDESVLPEAGTEVTSEEFDIPTGQHKGVDLWSEPVWSPALVTEDFGHLKFKINGVDITKENVDAPWHWPNIWG